MTEFAPPQPNAALVVGPGDVLVLSFPGTPSRAEVKLVHEAIKRVGLTGRVLCAWDAQISVVLADAPGGAS